MSNITVQEAQAWLDKSKLLLGDLDDELEMSCASQVLARVASVYDISGWTTSGTTPRIIRTIISMFYASWYYERTYSEDSAEGQSYSARLRESAGLLLDGVVGGAVSLVEETDSAAAQELSEPVFYPTDTSSAQEPTDDDPSLGPAVFTMGRIF